MILFTEVSGNKKTGPIPVSGSQGSTCPKACPFSKKKGKFGGCYAAYGAIKIHWDRLNNGKAGITWGEFLNKIKNLSRGQLWRHCQFGDLPGKSNKIDTVKLAQLVKANYNRKGFGYSHKAVLNEQDSKSIIQSNRKAIKHANENGFTINLSGNNADHADKLVKLKIGPVVSIIPIGSPKTQFTKAGNKIIKCPAAYMENMNCLKCRLCQNVNRSVIIGFEAHGTAKNMVNAISTNAQ